MSGQSIDEFAELLINLVRDRAIKNCVARLSPDTRSPIGKEWQHSIGDNYCSAAIQERIIPDCVDEVIFCLLNAIDEEAIRLEFLDSRERRIDLSAVGKGELAGWYMGEENWREQFSHEKLNNYL